jgi:hypothetical protein
MAVRDFPKVLISSLESWGDGLPGMESSQEESPPSDFNGTLFGINHALNKKMYLWYDP